MARRRCPVGTTMQSVLFPRGRWSEARARAWLRRHGKKVGKVDVTKGFLRFRQKSPGICRPGEFANIPLGKKGVRAVICCPRKPQVRKGHGFGNLGIEPVTVGVIAVGTVAVPFILGLFGGKKPEGELPPLPGGPAPKCSPEEVKQAYIGAVQGAVSGATTGATVGPIGAAVGAGVGGSVAFLSNRCGLGKLNEAKKALCKNADKMQKELDKRQAGVPGWDKLSCDQKIGVMAALGPAGLAVGAVTAGTIAAANSAKKEVCRATDKALARLDAKGAKLPKGIEDWSCDQKAAFIVALGPFGVTAALTGVLAGTLASNTVDEVSRNFDRAKDAVSSVSKKLGVKVPEMKVGGTAGSIAKKIGIGDWPDDGPNSLYRVGIEEI